MQAECSRNRDRSTAQPTQPSAAAARSSATRSRRTGCDTVFGYAGGAILHFYDALHRDPALYHVTVRHEQGAAHAAAGYARASGRAGVCVATSGPGATNLVTGIMDAHMDSVADGRAVRTGRLEADRQRRVPGDRRAVDHGVGDQARLPAAPRRRARGDRPRRVPHRHAPADRVRCVIDVPKDVLMATTSRRAPRRLRAARLPQPRRRPTAAAIAAAADAAASRASGRCCCSAAARSSPTPARRCARSPSASTLPVVTTINAKGVIPESHPQAHGMIGMYGRKSGVWAMIAVRPAARLRLPLHRSHHRRRPAAFAAGKQLVHVDVDAYELGKNVPAARRDPGRRARRRRGAAARRRPAAGRARRSGAGRARRARRADDLRALRAARGRRRRPPARRSWTRSTACAARTTSSPPASASTRCSPATSSSTSGRARSSARAAPARWASACRRRSARPAPSPTRASSSSTATAASR